MKGKKEQKGSSKKFTPSSLDECEKKRRSSLTDTPITSSSSSEGMASTDSQPCSSKTTTRKKRKSQKKASVDENSNSPPSIERLEIKTSNLPVYTKANSSTTNTTSVAHPRCSIAQSNINVPVANCSMDVVLNRTDPNKFLLMSMENNEWMKKLRNALIEGNHSVFLCGIRYMCVILCRNDVQFNDHTQKSLVQYVIERLVASYYDAEHQKTVFMDLCSTRNKKCSEVGHDFCRLARTLLQNMSKESVTKQLNVATKNQCRSALHLAVMTGDLCQVRVLLEFEIDVDTMDQQNRTPLFYALKGKNLDMVKLLMWYGADFSHGPSYETKLYLHAEIYDKETIGPWFDLRINALNKKFYQFANELCRDAFVFRKEDAISDMHVMRCSHNGEHNILYSVKTDNWHIRSITLNMRAFESTANNAAVLFIIPFCYNPQDQASPADMPCIFRTALMVNNELNNIQPLELFPTKPLLQTPDDKVFELVSAIQQNQNGHLHALRLLDKLEKKQYTLSMNVELGGLSEKQKRTTLFGIQAFRVTPQKINHKKFN